MTSPRSLILLFYLLSLGLPSFGSDPSRVPVLFSGGGDWHPYAQCSGALIDAMRKSNKFSCSYSEDLAALQYDHLKHFKVLVIYNGVCYLGDDKKQKDKTPSYVPTSITRFVREGGGLIVVHSGMASFSDWKEYINLIGGVWVWGTSAHDKYGTLKSEVVSDHPIVQGLPRSFEFQDEFYHTLNILPSVKVLIQATHQKNGKQVTEPLAWVTGSTNERVATILYGHDMGSWKTPIMQQLMIQAIEWAAHLR